MVEQVLSIDADSSQEDSESDSEMSSDIGDGEGESDNEPTAGDGLSDKDRKLLERLQKVIEQQK